MARDLYCEFQTPLIEVSSTDTEDRIGDHMAEMEEDYLDNFEDPLDDDDLWAPSPATPKRSASASRTKKPGTEKKVIGNTNSHTSDHRSGNLRHLTGRQKQTSTARSGRTTLCLVSVNSMTNRA